LQIAFEKIFHANTNLPRRQAVAQSNKSGR